MVGGNSWTAGLGRARHHPGDVVQGGQLSLQALLLLLLQLEPLPPPEQGPVLEHGDRLGVKSPVGSLAGSVRSPGDLDEAVVEAEVVSQRILPSLGVLSVVGEVVHDEFINV